MTGLPNWINDFRLGAEVERMHTQPTIRHNTNGHHTLNTMAIAMYLMECNGINMLSEKFLVLSELLIHDIPEMHTGDIPGPTKAHPKVNEVMSDIETDWLINHMPDYMLFSTDQTKMVSDTTVMSMIVKFADRLELLWWAVEEKEMGNRRISIMYETCLEMVREMWNYRALAGVGHIINHLDARWRALK